MDDPAIFSTFLQVGCGMIVRVRNEFITFVDTFETLLTVTDTDIDAFVKSTHAANTARAVNIRLLISPNSVLNIKAVLFELQDRLMCDALPTVLILQALDAAQISAMKAQKSQATIDAANALLVTYPDMPVPKLTTTNFEAFNIAFEAVVSRTKGMNGIPLDYLIRTTDGVYTAIWPTRDEKLKMCTRHNGPNFRRDTYSLYSLYVQYVGTEGTGSNIVNRHTRSRNGYTCHQDFNSHFRNAAHNDNKASNANLAISQAVYRGERRNFTLETYYGIMSKAFNDLGDAGVEHSLNEQKKVTAFEQGLKEQTAITWYITAKDKWDNLPIADQNFDNFYNEFAKYMNNFKTLTVPDARTARIAQLDTGSSSSRERERGRGRDRGR